jgi:hypothetical protein
MPEQAVEDAVALWVAVFGTPPPIRTDVALLLEIAVSCCPSTLPYTPAMRPTDPGGHDPRSDAK